MNSSTSTTTELLHAEVYPRLFDQLESALPEFEFKRKGHYYQSTSGYKVDGSVGEKGKVFVYANNISLLKDYSREAVSIWDYIQKRDNLSQQQTLKTLADLAGYPLPTNALSEEHLQFITENNRKAKIWEDINLFFRHCLAHPDNEFARSSSADVMRKYLVNDRGYGINLFALPDEKITATSSKIEVGFVPSLHALQNHLINEVGYSSTEVMTLINETGDPAAKAQALLSDSRIGRTHRLAIPYRDPSGRIRGMIFRTIQTGAEPKYIKTESLNGLKLLFNLKAVGGDRDLVIVEGQLDAMHAAAQGIPNVVALGTNTLSREHIEQAIKSGARKITLLLDPDKAGRIGTDKALELFRQFPQVRPYVAFIDPEYKDLDKLLSIEGGVDKARRIISEASDGWRYLLERVVDRYAQADELTDKEIEGLLNDIVQTAGGLSRIDSDLFIQRFVSNASVQALGVSSANLQAVANELRQAKDNAERDKAIRGLQDEISNLLQRGQGDKALSTMLTKSREIKEANRTDEFKVLLKPTTEDEVQNRRRLKPDSLNLGLKIDNVEVVIPAGALSLFVGPTSHGKTTLLINAALLLAKQYPKKRFDFFSYEEDEDAIRLKMLNAYISEELAFNNRESIGKYYTGKQPIFFRDQAKVFHQKRAEFFSELIESGRINIHYVSYNSDTLIDAIRYISRAEDLGGILIDYIQMLNLPAKKYQTYSRQEELKQICLDLKDLATETGLPLIAGSQFNRSVTNLTHMHATRIAEAGDIERAANFILGFWNNNRKPLNPSEAEQKIIDNKLYSKPTDSWYVEVLKNRDGRVEHYDLWDYNGNTGKVRNL